MDERLERAERLQWAREHAGFATASEAARAVGVGEPTYLGHENGSRGYHRNAERYARRFRVRLEWLWSGQGSPVNVHVEGDAETELLEAFRKLPPDEADAYRQLILRRAQNHTS